MISEDWKQRMVASVPTISVATQGEPRRGSTRAICELMDLTDNIRDMILERRPTSEIKRAARDSGMTFLRQCAVDLVMNGVSTLREVNKVTFVE